MMCLCASICVSRLLHDVCVMLFGLLLVCFFSFVCESVRAYCVVYMMSVCVYDLRAMCGNKCGELCFNVRV